MKTLIAILVLLSALPLWASQITAHVVIQGEVLTATNIRAVVNGKSYKIETVIDFQAEEICDLFQAGEMVHWRRGTSTNQVAKWDSRRKRFSISEPLPGFFREDHDEYARNNVLNEVQCRIDPCNPPLLPADDTWGNSIRNFLRSF